VNDPSVANPEGAVGKKAGPARSSPQESWSAPLSIARGPAHHQTALSRASEQPCRARLTQQLRSPRVSRGDLDRLVATRPRLRVSAAVESA
jgi:hypothetical protein